jgi:hypothetical protein
MRLEVWWSFFGAVEEGSSQREVTMKTKSDGNEGVIISPPTTMTMKKEVLSKRERGTVDQQGRNEVINEERNSKRLLWTRNEPSDSWL